LPGDLPYVSLGDTHCVPRGHGFLFFPYVPLVSTYGILAGGCPYVRRGRTGSPTGPDGFGPPTAAGGICELLTAPLFRAPSRRRRAVGKVGKAIFCENPAAVRPEKALAGLAQKPEVLVFGKPAHNRS